MWSRLGVWALVSLLAVACGRASTKSEPPRGDAGVQPGEGGAGGEGSMEACGHSAVACGDACVDVSVDPRNCGACGVVCAAGMLCSDGACATTCGAPTTECGGACVDLTRDREHCGSCEVACAETEFCTEGSCAAACSTGTTACAGRCVNTDEDPDHCGACGTVCAANEVCSNGTCELGCFGGTSRCGDRCVDLQIDPRHCGACKVACEQGEVCDEGTCGVTCSGGTVSCAGRCVDLNLDPDHCGACGDACEAGEVCLDGECSVSCGERLNCDGRCVSSDTDRRNCGGCGVECASSEVCSLGECGQSCENSVKCDGDCTDILTDAAHCGGCDKSCGIGEKCQNGTCGLFCEEVDLLECAGECVDPLTDRAHCGTCYGACGNGYECRGGACECETGAECNGVCVDTSTSVEHCGVCGVACAFNEACTGGVCDCRPGTTRCGDVCFDTDISSAHCGGCDSECPAGKVCTDGECDTSTTHWRTFQSDIQHSGVATETGVPPLTWAWSREIVANSPVIEGGRLFVSSPGRFANEAPLHAFNVSDGTELWKYNFGGVSSVGTPSVFDGNVYIANGKGISSPPAYVWSIDGASGVVNWAAAMASQWETYWAPIVVGDVVYSNGGTYGGLYGLDTDDGAQKFFVSLDQYDVWSPGYASGNVFTFIAGHFRKHDPATGAIVSTVNMDWGWNGYTMGTAPVLAGGKAFVIAPPNLVALDVALDQIAWTANGTYTGTPAVSGNEVYGISAGNLVVRSATSGSLLWTFVGDSAFRYPPVVANGYVYVASDDNVYAVDTTTHMAVWSGSPGGKLVIGARRLIVTGTQTVDAYVLSE